MPSDANGVYSLPDGYQGVQGTTIQPSQHNPPLEDLAEAVTGRLPRNGAAPMTGALKGVNGTAAAPSFTFNSATGTGWFKTTNGLGVSINGVQVAEFTGAGLKTGTRFIGELIPHTGSTAPALCVVPVGQTLSRTAFADLWAHAQIEIAAGNTFYNNGNGTDTFGIGDCRGRVIAGFDPGNVTGRLNGGLAGGVNSAVLGGVGGAQGHQLNGSEMPSHSHPNALNELPHTHGVTGGTQTGVTGVGLDGGALSGLVNPVGISISPAATGITISNAAVGGGALHNNVQPTLIGNFALFAGA